MTDTTTATAVQVANTTAAEATIAADGAEVLKDVATIADDVVAAAAVVSTVSVWTAILGFFTALPGIIMLIQQFMGWLNTISGSNPQVLISELGQTFSQLNAAKTQEDRLNAAKNLANLGHHLP